MIIYVSFFSPFFSQYCNILFIVFFKVRVRTISIVNARSRRRIFFRAWVAIIRQRGSGDRFVHTRNLAPRDRSPPSGFTQSLGLLCRDCSSFTLPVVRYVRQTSGRTSEGFERCRYACRDRSCSPTVPVVTSHIMVDGRARGASDDRYTCCRRSCSPTRYVTRATLRVYCDMGLLGFCEEYYIF